MGVLVRFKPRNGSIDNRVMGAAVLNDRIGSRNIFAEKNLMIENLVPDIHFQSFTLVSAVFCDTTIYFTKLARKCQYLILVYIINTC